MGLIPQSNCHVLMTSNRKEWILCSETLNRLFEASHSRDTKPPSWREKVALGLDKQNTYYIILNGNFLCLSCPSATFALQHGGFAAREWLAAKGLLGLVHTKCKCTCKRGSHVGPYAGTSAQVFTTELC